MSLVATTTAAVEAAFSAASDTVVAVTWRRLSNAAYDPATGAMTNTETDQLLRAVRGLFDANTMAKYDLSANAIRLYVPGVDFGTEANPRQEDQILFDGVTYNIKRAFYEGIPVLWEVWADV